MEMGALHRGSACRCRLAAGRWSGSGRWCRSGAYPYKPCARHSCQLPAALMAIARLLIVRGPSSSEYHASMWAMLHPAVRAHVSKEAFKRSTKSNRVVGVRCRPEG